MPRNRAILAALIALSICLHPPRVHSHTTASSADIIAHINYVNETAVPPHGDYSIDINRDENYTTADYLRLIDLYNGAHEYEIWNGTNLPLSQPCACTAQQAMSGGSFAFGGGGGLSNAALADAFLNLLAFVSEDLASLPDFEDTVDQLLILLKSTLTTSELEELVKICGELTCESAIVQEMLSWIAEELVDC